MGAWDDLEERAAKVFGSDDCGTSVTPGKPWRPPADAARPIVTTESLRTEAERLLRLGDDFHGFMLAAAADLIEDLTAERSDAWDRISDLEKEPDNEP